MKELIKSIKYKYFKQHFFTEIFLSGKLFLWINLFIFLGIAWIIFHFVSKYW